MVKHFRSAIIALFIIVPAVQAFASPQVPDFIIYRNDTIATYNLMLEQYLQSRDTAASPQLFGLSFRGGNEISFSCWRGYQAIYKIENDSLFLVDIIRCGERRNGKIDKAASYQKMKAIFGDELINNRVFINWFLGDISFPINNKVIRWDGVFYTIFEKETVVNIVAGKVLKTEAVVNYVDNPKGIDRRNARKISAILFKKLKKLKWKNAEDFDCSEKYLITIDKNGNVSKVRMIYNEEEIDKHHDRDEYNFCTQKIYNALKGLKFDIIKDKGKPISEDIYLWLWINDNGKAENWSK